MLDRERLKETTKLLDEFRTAGEFESFTKTELLFGSFFICVVSIIRRTLHISARYLITIVCHRIGQMNCGNF